MPTWSREMHRDPATVTAAYLIDTWSRQAGETGTAASARSARWTNGQLLADLLASQASPAAATPFDAPQSLWLSSTTPTKTATTWTSNYRLYIAPVPPDTTAFDVDIIDVTITSTLTTNGWYVTDIEVEQ